MFSRVFHRTLRNLISWNPQTDLGNLEDQISDKEIHTLNTFA